MSFRSISAALRGKWFIDPDWAQSHLGLVVALLEGKPVELSHKDNRAYDDGEFVDRTGTEEADSYYVRIAVPRGNTYKVSRYRSFDEAPDGSIAVINVQGPIMKYGGDCGEPGSIHFTQMVKAADTSSKIKGIILQIDSPGGMVDGTATLADTIKQTSKPVTGYVDDGMCASAAMWIGSACDELYASRKTDSVGSIGVLCTIADYKGYFEKLGIKVMDIYAPESTEKNLDYRKAIEEGDTKLIEQDLSVLAQTFIRAIKTNRGERLDLSLADPFKGACYYADKALAIGLIDGIKSFDEVVERMNEQVTSGKKATSKKTNTMFGNKFKALAGLKDKKAEDVNESIIEAINAELKENGIETVAVVTVAELQQAGSAIASIKSAEQKAEAEIARITKEAGEKETELNAKIVSLQEEIETLGKQPGSKPTAVKKPGVDAIESAPVVGTQHQKMIDEANNLA